MGSVVIHAHCYQPPREDPRTGQVPREANAAPWHDWNARIEQECYRALAQAETIPDPGRERRVNNLYERISFDFGPILLEWLSAHAPTTYRAILAGDGLSARRLGHGNAIATPYHHIILPLATRRDKVTEVRWGIRDFSRRFGRDPAGLWLPETAVDLETLDVLAAEGIRFTILAPHQVTQPHDGLPSLVRTPRGKDIIVFAYDGPLSHDVAFGSLTRDADAWRDRIVELTASGRDLVAMATDGETYGHHHTFAEMALAAVLDKFDRGDGLRGENFASFLAHHPPPSTRITEIVENTSWSCVHGVERWRADCGCRIKQGTSQAWRAPLREALDWLRDRLAERFETATAGALQDPWSSRDAHEPGPVPGAAGGDPMEAQFESQRHALRMFTSCGWFFDDPTGLETLICLRSAARAIELSSAGERLAPAFRDRLRKVHPRFENEEPGAEVFDRLVGSGPELAEEDGA